MGRTRRTRLWIALPGGIAINGVLLAGLLLFERPPPMADEPPVVTLSLDRLEIRRRTSASPLSPSRGQAPTRPIEQTPKPTAEAPIVSSQTAPSKLVVEPGWVIGDGAYLTPETAGPARRFWDAADQRRYQRACIGLSNEHMTPEEKDRCWDAWGGAKPVDDKRIGPREVPSRNFGPLALKDPAERGPFAKQARRQERCRDYRKRTMPGLKGVEPPPLREGGCF